MKKRSPKGIKIGPVDQLFSRLVREKANGQCQRCGGYPRKGGLHAAHFITRGVFATRFDEANALALCLACHNRVDGHPVEKMELWLSVLGQEEYDALVERSRVIVKRTPAVIDLTRQRLLKRLAESHKDWHGD